MNITSQQRSESCCALVAEVARSFGEVRLKVTGSSMVPSIWPGDLVTVRRQEMPTLQSGHVIVYKRDAVLVTHRITHTYLDHVITRGDSVWHDDAPVKEADIVGRVICLVRNGRRVRLNPSYGQRLISFFLRRSDFYRRIMVRLSVANKPVSNV
jgi:signal peptidase I